MYLTIISWFFVVSLTMGLVGLAVGLGLASIDDHHDRQPRLWPQIVMEIGGVLLGVGIIVFGSVKLAILDNSLHSILDLAMSVAALIVGILWLTFIALGLMRYKYEVRLISYRLNHPIEEIGYDDESEVFIINKDVYLNNN
jgi:hypothetical protein